MKRAILFRFHKNSLVCANRVDLLRHFNPDTGIYGLYGGGEREFRSFQKRIGLVSDDIYCIQGKSPEWKWKNGDMAVRSWFLEFGRNVPFDMLHIIEWDMLLCDSVENIFSMVPENGMGLAGLMPLKEIGDRWIWASHASYREEIERLLSYARDRFQYSMEPYRCIAGGACLPRRFIEKYAEIEVPELCNDEVRLPLFAQIFGIDLHDAGFYKMDEEERRYFNLFRPVDIRLIREELEKPGGRRIFHPYYRLFNKAGEERSLYNLKYDIRESVKGLMKALFGEKRYRSLRERFRKDFKPVKKK